MDRLEVIGDVRDLDALLTNLVANAIKYSEPDDRVRVRLDRVEGADGRSDARIEVVDQGVGIR